MEMNIGDTVEWVKRTQTGRTIDLRVVTSTVAEVRGDHVVVKARNGRRRRIAKDSLTAVNGIRIERPAQEPADAEEAQSES